ncbi:MAG TPA: class I SAM-dependent methyltransferase [Pyrinomonadaceae bacterium]|nr:class I SAM-dependent methyltransferase [Pyrinomonadaceae bacterium]
MTSGGSSACRSCGNASLQPVLSLGRTPLANALLNAEQLAEEEEMFPLDLAFCPECTLVQITETVPADKLFREYFYLSSFSDTMLQHAADIATQMIEARHLGRDNLVVELASNDGYLLRHYKSAGVRVLGIEPAVNIARVAEEEHGIPTIPEFFTEFLARMLRLSDFDPDVVHANNVLAHVGDLNDFVFGLGILLKIDGVAVIEVPYVKDMIDACEFDTIYHEHLSYFSLTALNELFNRNLLNIWRVERLPIHGGTLRLYASYKRDPESSVLQLLAEEAAWVRDSDFYTDFSNKVGQLRQDLLGLLQKLKSQGKRIAVYGASAKGSTLLNYFGIGKETLEYVVDRSTVKQGLYTPGTHLQIHSPNKLLSDMPDYVLLLTWNFADEILEQQTNYRQKGGRFIIPIPSVKVV